jgi:ABC-type bacteriocin/lantibiotic exporter with double-glycine peptidase domain
LIGLASCTQLSYTGGARTVNPTQLDGGTHWLRAASTPVVKQTTTADCGLAALAMIAGAWGQQVTLAELATVAPPSKSGVKLGKLRDVARARGLDAFAIAGTYADLEHELRNGRPVLLGLLLPFERDRALNHYEVAVALDTRDGTVITIDPSTGGHLRRSRETLEKEWKPAGHATLVVVGERPKTAEGTARAGSHSQESSP